MEPPEASLCDALLLRDRGRMLANEPEVVVSTELET